MARAKKVYRKKEVYRSGIIAVILMILCAALSYFLLTTDTLEPTINELTASYISFNNSNATDMLKIQSLQKMNNTKGISYKNNSYVSFKVDGTKKSKYKIVLYPLGNIVEDEYVNFSIFKDKKEIIREKLSNMKDTKDNGKVIYESSLKEKSHYTVKMWINDSYKKEPNNVSYELKIK